MKRAVVALALVVTLVLSGAAVVHGAKKPKNKDVTTPSGPMLPGGSWNYFD